jgi:carboxymethylenebutenolidase
MMCRPKEHIMNLHNEISTAQALLGAHSSPNRRGWMQAAAAGAVGVGYAAAAGTVMAQTALKTPSDGLTVGEITIDVALHKMPVYRAAPANAAGKLPVVLVLSEIFGVHEYIADVARRFAKAGYLALAPELFGRQGDPTAYNEIAKLVAEVVSKVPDAQVATDLDACAAWANANGGDAERLAVTGFCWGGRQTWLYAAHNPKVKAAVAWYGRLVGQSNALQPKHPIDVVGQLHAPTLGLYGEKDTGIALDTVEKMKAALATASMAASTAASIAAKRSEFVIYPDAPHAFHADYRPSFRPEAAQDGFKRCLAWMKQHGA